MSGGPLAHESLVARFDERFLAGELGLVVAQRARAVGVLVSEEGLEVTLDGRSLGSLLPRLILRSRPPGIPLGEGALG